VVYTSKSARISVTGLCYGVSRQLISFATVLLNKLGLGSLK